MTIAETMPRKLSTSEKDADVAARAAIGTQLFIAGDLASNSYWACPRRQVEVVLDRAGLEYLDGRYEVDGPGKVTHIATDPPAIAKLFDDSFTIELAPALIPGTDKEMFAQDGTGQVFARPDGKYVALNHDYLGWLVGDALPHDVPTYRKRSSYRLLQRDGAKLDGPVLIVVTTTYGAEHKSLLMPIRMYTA